MNKLPNRYSVSYQQTSKGILYLDKVQVDAGTKEELMQESDWLLAQIKERLDKINSGDTQ